MLQYVSQLSNSNEVTGYHLILAYKATIIKNFSDAAAYLLSIDIDRSYFVREPLEKGLIGEDVSKANFRLNKLLHLVNILYYTKEGKAFSEGNFCALSHGAVVEETYYQLDKSYKFRYLLERKSNLYSSQPPYFSNLYFEENEKKNMLSKVFNRFKQYSDRQLVLFSQEDPAWMEAQKNKEKYLLINKKIIRFYQKFYKHVLKEIDCFD